MKPSTGIYLYKNELDLPNCRVAGVEAAKGIWYLKQKSMESSYENIKLNWIIEY